MSPHYVFFCLVAVAAMLAAGAPTNKEVKAAKLQEGSDKKVATERQYALISNFTRQFLPPATFRRIIQFGELCDEKDGTSKKVEEPQGLLPNLKITGMGSNTAQEFEDGQVHFLIVKTDIYYPRNEDLIKTQEDFIRDTLKNLDREKVPWVVVLGDRPFLCADAFGECKYTNTTASYERKELKGLSDLLDEYMVDLAIWGKGSRYERFLPVHNRQVFFNYGIQVKDTYVDPPATVHMIIGTQDGCQPVDVSKKWSRSPWSGFATGRGQEWGYVTISVHNSSHLHIQQDSTRNLTKPDDIWLVKHSHTTAYNVSHFEGGMKISPGFCFHQDQCPPEHKPFFG